MSTIQLEGASHPIDFKSYEQDNIKKNLIEIIKYVALKVLFTLGGAFYLYCCGGISFTAALITFNLPSSCTFFLSIPYAIIVGLDCFAKFSIFINSMDLFNHFRISRKLQLKKEDALIIQSPDFLLASSTLVQLSEKFNLKIYTASSRDDAKSILHSFPKNSIKLLIFSGHGNPDALFLGRKDSSGRPAASYVTKYHFSSEDNVDFKYLVSPLVELIGKVKNFVTGKRSPLLETWCGSFGSLAKDGMIILHSCSTGEGEGNLAQAISSLANRTVIAASEAVGSTRFEDSLILNDFTTSKIRFLTPILLPIYGNHGVAMPFFKKDVTVAYKDGKKV